MCVFETFAALFATHQAEAATDRAFGEAMRTIARDEASHAAIARDLDASARGRLDAGERARLDAAHAATWTEVVTPTEAASEPALGMPCGRTRARIASALEAALTAS